MGAVVAFTSKAERVTLVRCPLGHEYPDLAQSLDLDCGSVPSCRECGRSLVDCVYNPDGTRRLPASSPALGSREGTGSA